MFSSYYMDRFGHVYPNQLNQDDVRVAVIAYEDREQAKRVFRGWCENLGGTSVDDQIDAMQAALCEFANPTPPKPEEPTGLGAVVEDAEGTRWIRTHDTLAPWQRHNFEGSRYYDGINAVRVLSEGVS